MSRTNRRGEIIREAPSIPPDLPESLAESVLAAKEHAGPVPGPEEAERLKAVLEHLVPRKLRIPPKDDHSVARDVWCEPLLSLSWDKRAGHWKWAISNRQLNVRVSGYLGKLDDALLQIEAALQSRNVQVSRIKDSGILT